MLSFQNMQMHRGTKTSIKNSSVKVSSGEIVALLGQNGAGKTTLLHFIAGILKGNSADT